MYFLKFEVYINMKLNYASDLFSWKYRINMSKIDVVVSIYEIKSGPDHQKNFVAFMLNKRFVWILWKVWG